MIFKYLIITIIFVIMSNIMVEGSQLGALERVLLNLSQLRLILSHPGFFFLLSLHLHFNFFAYFVMDELASIIRFFNLMWQF